MDLVYVAPDGKEKGVVQHFESLDMVTGLSNDVEEHDFRLEVATSDYNFEFGGWIYIEGTEFGGKIERIETQDTIYYSGKTWRGFLLMKCIEPPSGQAYFNVNGDAHDVIRQLISGRLGNIYSVKEGLSRITVSGQIRYEMLGAALNRLLKAAGARLCIQYIDRSVVLSVEPVTDYSDSIEFSQDYGVKIISDEDRSRYNSIIALGSGEGTARHVVKLWLLPNGIITDNANHPNRPRGENERQYLYDYPNAQEDTLRDDAERQLLEVANQKVFEIDISEMTQNVELGDIVGARDRRTGLYYKSDIYKKVFRIDTNGVTITHEVRKEGE